MSKISLKPNASGTANFSIEAPNSNTDRTLTLPDEEGTVATIENIPPGYEDQDALDLFNVSGSAPVYACRAWVNFDGTGPTIRESGNVSSITDEGTGKYTVNFTNTMPDTNYSLSGMTEAGGNSPSLVGILDDNGLSSSNAQIFVRLSGSGSLKDRDVITLSFFR